MKYEAVIGLEVHVQLRTESKMFCSCRAGFGDPPNTNVCPVCLGYPGAMPVMNEKAIRHTVTAGLMLGSEISSYSRFDRKSYFYPDMPKNYQISQYDMPLCIGGSLDIEVDGVTKTVNIARIHLEEDVAKNTHLAGSSGIDFNRAGTPLMEVVTEPIMVSPEEAFAFLLSLKRVLQYTGVSECNLERGNMRCDVNCSVRPAGESKLGTKTEIKNMNTFKGIYNALKYEIGRQVQVLDEGGTIEQETRRWDVDTGITLPMRSKEEAHDYRYFPEPDLMPVALGPSTIDQWRRNLPELPRQRRMRFAERYGLSEYDAKVLCDDKAVADYYEKAAEYTASYKSLANWIMTEILRELAESGKEIGQLLVPPESLARLVEQVEKGVINSISAKKVLTVILANGGDAESIVKEKGLAQVSDTDSLEDFADRAIAENAKSASDYRAGKKAALQFLMGQVMKMSKGKANPPVVLDILRRKLDSGG
jgi:aspartyl-tRNA(Asn)/glutamyl-tRNA(Gln) amidotransferase subunit B